MFCIKLNFIFLDNLIDDEEVFVSREVVVHRNMLKSELIVLFSSDDIFMYELRFKVINERGEEEKGRGSGVTRDIICSFFSDFYSSNTEGREEKIPTIRHDMSRPNWKAVARIIVYALRVDYFPLCLSKAFLLSVLFGEDLVSESTLLDSFKNYVSLEEKQTIIDSLVEYSDESEEILDLLSSYNCKSRLTTTNFPQLISELAHQELIQKPRYIGNCFSEVFSVRRLVYPLTTADDLEEYYNKSLPSSRKVINSLQCDPACDNERSVLNHLTRFIKSLGGSDLRKLLRFVTGGDLMPSNPIKIAFVNQIPRAPRASTCSSTLHLSADYSCFNELAEEFSNVLENPNSFAFWIV